MALTLAAVAVGGLLAGGAISLHRQRAPRAVVVAVTGLAAAALVLAAMIAR